MSRSENAFGGGSSSGDSDSEHDDFLYPSVNPGAEEFADHNPRKRRKTGRDAKESAALGVFGSESEDEGFGKKWKRQNMRSKGMAFVSSGQRAGRDDDEEEDEDEDDTEARRTRLGLGMGPAAQEMDVDIDEENDDDEEDDDSRPRLGIGLGHKNASQHGSPKQGLGLQNPMLRHFATSGEAASPFGRGFTPSSSTVPALNRIDNPESNIPRVAMPSAFSTPTNARVSRGAASTTTATNPGSFAARMMAKMGYKEGQGLGRDGQGRSGIIEVQLRPQGVGVGAVKEKSKQEKDEERRQAALKGVVLEDSDDERKKQKAKIKSRRAETGMVTPKQRRKTKYQSLPEIRRAAPGLEIPEAFTPILDMTGPAQRLLMSTSGLLTPTAGIESVEVIEAKKLARRAQGDLGAFVEEWKNLQERKAWVEMEILQQRQAIDEQSGTTEQIDTVVNLVQGLADTVKDAQWEPVIKALRDVEDVGLSGLEELGSIAVAAVHPFLRQAIEGWQPLNDPKLSGVASEGFAPALLSIRHLLGLGISTINSSALALAGSLNGEKPHRKHKTSAYESMMYNVWLPKIRSAITNVWDVYDPVPLQALLSSWENLLPPFIHSQIYDQMIVGKLDKAVDGWDPKRKRHAPLPHLWLFPWLQFLPSHHADPKSSTGLVSDIKRKFRQLIDSWDFKRGVIPGLKQWRAVLQPKQGPDQWTPLMMNHVVPSLARFLRTHFQIAPQDQEPFMRYLYSTFEWQDILGAKVIGQILVDEMFPMWHDVLHQWLTLDGVNYLEIRDWFDFWMTVVPADLNALPAVKAEWQKGNDLINRALDLGDSAKTSLPAPAKASETARPPAPVKPATTTKPAPEAEEITFRHQLEDWCMSRELQFIPEKSTLEANGPVYRVTAAAIGKGGVLIYLRGDRIYAQIKRGAWTLLGTEMDALYELAHR